MRQVTSLAILVVLVFSVVASASLPEKHWGIGVQLNYPFTGFSIRLFTPDGLGFEFNIFPNPTSRYLDDGTELRRLELTLSGKLLYPVRQDGNVNYYFSGGAAVTFAFEQSEEDVRSGLSSPKIQSNLDDLVIAGMGVIEIEGIWLDRLVGTFEYGLSWDLFAPLNFSFFNGGIGFHYYI
jgi:hypothetical protein